MLGLTFNQATALLGIVYAAVLFYYYRKLKAVWKREGERARYGVIVFTILTIAATFSSCYVYYMIKKRRFLQQKAASLIQMEIDKPKPTKASTWFGKFVKIFAIGVITFICLHRIIKKT